MNEQPSVVMEQAVDPFLARLALERLQARVRDAVVATLVAAAAGLAFLAIGNTFLAVALLAGATAGGAVSWLARADRVTLIARLVRQRSAYDIEEVAQAGEALVAMAARDRVAATLGRLLLEADGFVPANPAYATQYDRIRAVRDDVLAVAMAMADPAVRIHPAAMVLATRLLTLATLSPLYNADVPGEHLRVALRRVQGGLETA